MSHVCSMLALVQLCACAAEAGRRADDEAPPSQVDASSASVPDAGANALDTMPASDAGTPTEVAPDAAELDAGTVPGPRDAAVSEAQIDVATTRTPLVTPDGWLLLDAAVDPFDDRPATIDCSSAGVVSETLSDERVLSVETGWCNYLSALQLTQRVVQPGELIKVRLWHFELSAPEPAEAHVAVHIGALRVLDERISIPRPGGLIVKYLTVDQAISAGSPVHFHLHNHGANSWALVEVSAGPPTPR